MAWCTDTVTSSAMPWGQKHREAAEAVADHCLRDRPLGAKGRQDPTEAVECAETAPVAPVQALLGPMVDSEVAVPAAAAVEARLPVNTMSRSRDRTSFSSSGLRAIP